MLPYYTFIFILSKNVARKHCFLAAASYLISMLHIKSMLLNAFFQNTVNQFLQLHVVNLADNDQLGKGILRNRYRITLLICTKLMDTDDKFLCNLGFRVPDPMLIHMSRYVHAVKTDFRQFDRPLRGIGAIHFHYR